MNKKRRWKNRFPIGNRDLREKYMLSLLGSSLMDRFRFLRLIRNLRTLNIGYIGMKLKPGGLC